MRDLSLYINLNNNFYVTNINLHVCFLIILLKVSRLNVAF